MMIKIKNQFLFVVFPMVLAMTITSCKKEKEAEGINKQLYEMAIETDGFSWFGNSDALLDKSSGSGHSYPFLRTRYNDIAATKLDPGGRILEDAVFPEGSLVVKELYSNASSLGRYAVLYKKPNDSNADDNGWVWGYINADGTVAETAENSGRGCISCHSQQGSIDQMLMNKFFP